MTIAMTTTRAKVSELFCEWQRADDVGVTQCDAAAITPYDEVKEESSIAAFGLAAEIAGQMIETRGRSLSDVEAKLSVAVTNAQRFLRVGETLDDGWAMVESALTDLKDLACKLDNYIEITERFVAGSPPGFEIQAE